MEAGGFEKGTHVGGLEGRGYAQASPGGHLRRLRRFAMSSTIINVSNRLPVTVGEKIQRSSGGLVTAMEGVTGQEYDLKWIGWPGGVTEPQRQLEIERLLIGEYGYVPVFLGQEEAHAFYEGLSNSSLWPILHYMPNYMRYEDAWWEHYRNVNQRFADKVLLMARPGDLVWVHDYQLMLLPKMLKEAMPGLKVGFFLHTPFPSYEVFRCHPRRNELVEGMLGADQIGFHTYGYARHFRSAVLRLLGIDSEINRIRRNGHTTYLGVYPIGIAAGKFEAELDSPQHAEQLRKTIEANQGKRVVVAVERMDYTKGILHRLEAVDLFLADLKDRDHIRFVFVSVPSREEVEEYQTLREEVEARIGRLNGKYATLTNSPIHFIHGSVNFTELCALYSIAEAALVTPLIDGMNLVAKEYVACQREHAGALVLSEFAGAAEELFNALIVNPYDARAVADALHEALAMSDEEKQRRMTPMRARVKGFDAQAWASAFIRDLASRPATADELPKIEEACRDIGSAMKDGRRVAMFLDYDGTLRELEREPSAAFPNAAVRTALDRLRDRPNLDVTIISGRRHEELEKWLGEYPFALIAEHGASIRHKGKREWEQVDRNLDYGWKDEILKVMRQYEQSTPGSFVEEKRSSLVWHYRRSDPEFGAWKANALADELAAMTANLPVQVRHGRKIVEITSIHVNKGAAVARLLEEANYDVVLCAGDDQTDESMFIMSIRNLVSIKVGDGATEAQFRLANAPAFRRFLQETIERACTTGGA